MTVRIMASRLRLAGVAAAALCAASGASAQDVVLKMKDGSATIPGRILAYENDVYTFSSVLGDLKIPGDKVDCEGEACPAQPVVWDVSLWGKRRAFTEHVEKLAELVDAKTDGKFKLNLDYGGLAPSRENLDGVAAGTFPMAQFCNGYHPEKTPSLGVLELPFLGVSSLEQELALSLEVYGHPAVEADLARWNATLLMPSPQPQNNIIGVGMPPLSLDSFRGMTIRSTGGVGRAIEALGADSVTIPAPQVKDALTDGTVQAVAFAPHAHMAFGTLDSGLWWTTNLNPGTSNCPVVVNSAALGELDEGYRDALLSSVDEALDHYVANYNGATMDAWGPALEERGIIMVTINDEIIASIKDQVAVPAAVSWIAANTAGGLPAQELYDLAKRTIRGGS